MSGTFQIQYQGKHFEVTEGTRYIDFVGAHPLPDNLPVLLVLANGRLQELNRPVKEDCVVEPLTIRDQIGMATYRRSLNLLFNKAVLDVEKRRNPGKDIRITLNFSNGNGYYFTFRGEERPDEEFVSLVKKRMQELVEEDLPICRKTLSTYDAIRSFRKQGIAYKERLLKYRRVSTVNLYVLGDYQDYFYGYMVPGTGCLKVFDVCCYEDGVALVYPKHDEPDWVRPYAPFPKLFKVQSLSEDWNSRMGIQSVADLNDTITRGDIEHKLLVAEALQESRMSDIAQDIRKRGNVKFVMIAGPSSSGKTTFSRRLSIELTAHGLTPHPISLDNFYRDRQYCPRDENGEYDFECLEAYDLELIQEVLSDLVHGKEVELPYFNFLTGQREYHGQKLQMKNSDILVIEGIHGLNPKLSEHLPADCVYRVYISALTQLNIDDHNPISTTDGRLLRRIVRDYRTRGTDALETIRRWPSVRRGEEKYIFPHQENADVMYNSALIYELSVLKIYAEPLLFQVPENAPEYLEAKRLLKFLDYFLGTPSESVPVNSILREFIGGSCFDV